MRRKGVSQTLDLTKAATQMQVPEPNSSANTVISFILESVGSKTSLGVISATGLGT